MEDVKKKKKQQLRESERRKRTDKWWRTEPEGDCCWICSLAEFCFLERKREARAEENTHTHSLMGWKRIEERSNKAVYKRKKRTERETEAGRRRGVGVGWGVRGCYWLSLCTSESHKEELDSLTFIHRNYHLPLLMGNFTYLLLLRDKSARSASLSFSLSSFVFSNSPQCLITPLHSRQTEKKKFKDLKGRWG